MKKFIVFLSILLIFVLIFCFKNDILSYLESKFLTPTTINKNEYTRNYNFNYVAATDNFSPNNKQDIKNIYYTILNSGMDEFTFYCKREYTNCQNDTMDILKDQNIITNINNFVHPYNSIDKTTLSVYNNYGKIVIKNTKRYDEKMKIILNFDVDKIIEDNITKDMSDREKIKIIHDYIINHTKYDKEKADKKISKYKSDTAFGALEEGYAICTGYADSMMIFLDRFGIKNYKITADEHVWNYVNIDNEWYHLDLTWDDPVNNEGKDILDYKFFLITDEQLEKLDKTYHKYDKTIYHP